MALRYCRASAEQIKADTRAAELLKQDSRAFWKGVARDTSRKVTGFVNKICDATGETDICEMWKNHFSDLYITVFLMMVLSHIFMLNAVVMIT